MNKKRKDLFIVITLHLLGLVYAYLTRNMFIGKSLFAGAVILLPPVIYMAIRKKKNWGKVLLATLTFGIIFGTALSFYAEATNSWTTNDYIFNFRFFGLNTLEEILGHGLMALNIFTFYEHFIDSENGKLRKLYKYTIILGVLGFLGLLGVYYIKPTIFSTLPYPYVMIGLIAIIPTIYTAIKTPRILKKMLLTSAYFFLVWFTIQFFAVSYDYWSYPIARHIGMVTIGDIQYPFEELFFWMLLYAPTLVAYYEQTFDDNK